MQNGYGLNVFTCRNQYGNGLVDILRGKWRLIWPLAFSCKQNMLKATVKVIQKVFQ